MKTIPILSCVLQAGVLLLAVRSEAQLHEPEWPFGVDGGVPPEPRVERKVQCDYVHPAYFTTIVERRRDFLKEPDLRKASDDDAILLFRPEYVAPTEDEGASTQAVNPDPSTKRQDAGSTASSPKRQGKVQDTCEVVKDLRRNTGRMSVSERGEIILAFDPEQAIRYVGYLGRLEVKGRLISSNASSRAIEIPGYGEIGKAVPTAGQKASEIEDLHVALAALVGAADRVGAAREASRDGGTLADAGETGADAGNDAGQPGQPDAGAPGADGGVDFKKTTRAAGAEGVSEGEAEWVITDFYSNAEQYQAMFREIFKQAAFLKTRGHGDEERDDGNADSGNENKPVGDADFSLLLHAARQGLHALEQKEAILRDVSDDIAELETRAAQKLWRKALAELSGLASEIAVDKVGMDRAVLEDLARIEGLAETSGVRPVEGCALPSWDAMTKESRQCSETPFVEDCATFQKAMSVLCGIKPQDKSKLSETTKKDVHATMLSISSLAERIPSDLTSFRATRQEQLRRGSPSAIWLAMRRLASTDEEQNLEFGINKVASTAYLRTFLNVLYGVHYLKIGDPGRHLLAILDERIARFQAHNWRSVRLQPKVIGAKSGDIIEVTIAYLPGGTPVSSNSQEKQEAPTEADRPGSWTLRLIVDKVGWVLSAGPRLSLARSLDYQPTAKSFRGSGGTLVPGIGIDFDYYPGGEKSAETYAVCFLFSGLGVRVDYLDFDTSQAVEIGVEAHFSLLRKIVSLGLGYNVNDHRLGILLEWAGRGASDRNLYFSLGLGIEKIFDGATEVLADLSR